MPDGKRNGFDFLAPYYDQLASLIFRDAIKKAQISLLSAIPSQSDILILGGGTGWIIREILQKQPHCHIWFVDSSRGMIDLAIKNNSDTQSVTFICGTPASIPNRKFSVIILPFFLDMFSPEVLKKNVLSIAGASDQETDWLITDFVNQQKWWQKMLLKLMYYFFRIVCNLEAVRLPDWRRALGEMSFISMESGTFYDGFIESHRYRLIQKI